MPYEIDTRYYFTFFAIFIKLLEKFNSFCQFLQILCLSKDFSEAEKETAASQTYDRLFYYSLIFTTYLSSTL